MKRFLLLAVSLVALCAVPCLTFAQESTAAAEQSSTAPRVSTGSDSADRTATTAAVAAVTAQRLAKEQNEPDFLEHLVDVVLGLFNIESSGNTLTHYIISIFFLCASLLARRIVTAVVFPALRRLASKTQTTLDDKLFPALEVPAAAFIMVAGIVASLKVLKLSGESDEYISKGYTIAFSLVVFWGLWRAFGAVLDHAHEVARDKQLGIAAFMPWIKKSLLSVFVVVGVLLTLQSLGQDVKALLAGLGIGGLAFALAAQDTIANVFGSIVVAIDQPFKVGEAVRIGGNVGTVEDIGMRSTRIRMVDKSLMVIPNKTVASETITNLSRFTRRRVEQVIGLTYTTTAEQMNGMAAAIKDLILAEPEVDKNSVMVFFRDFSASSLDIWVVYETMDPDFQKAMRLRQRLNMAIMRAVEERGLSMAYPTQTIHFDGPVAKQLLERGDKPAS